MKNHKIVLLSVLLSFGAAATTQTDAEPLKEKVKYVIQNLDKATFQTVRKDWNHDYGLPDAGMLNTYEYLRSLVSYEQFQAVLAVKIFSKGPHTGQNLDLTNPYEFGYYNPEFVLRFHSALNMLLKDKQFTESTKAFMTAYGLIDKLNKLQLIHHYIDENPAEFERYVDNYYRHVSKRVWPEGDYRLAMPEKLYSDEYWNWSETVYHFWIRREIDGTKQLWINVINDLLTAYGVH